MYLLYEKKWPKEGRYLDVFKVGMQLPVIERFID